MPAESDTDFYAFRPDGPWDLRREPPIWLAETASLRQALGAMAPRLTRRAGLPPMRRFLQASWKLGSELLVWFVRERRQGGPRSRAALSRRLRNAFETLGPPYIKLGQILSNGRGLFPDELVAEFRTLRDQVRAEPFAVVQRVVEEDFGQTVDQLFAEFSSTPLAAASIAQVHTARLRTGELVAVKVQRPDVAELVRRDVAAMAWIAPFLVGRIPVAALANPPALVELFTETILEELDFRLEAQNMLDIAALLTRSNQRTLWVPRPHPRLVTRRVLVMEHLSGLPYERVEDLRSNGVDTAALLRTLVVVLLEGAMVYGVFHGDLHGGNLALTPDGQIVLFDYGITARMSEAERLAFLRLMMLGMVGDLRGQLEAYKELGALAPDTDVDELIRKLKLDQPPVDPASLTPEQLTREIQFVTKTLLGYGARLPKPLMLFVKNLIFLDEAVAHLAPDVNLFGEMLRIYGYFAATHGGQIAAEIGLDPTQHSFDLEAFKAGLGLRPEVEHLTHRDLQRRRTLIRKKFERAQRPTG